MTDRRIAHYESQLQDQAAVPPVYRAQLRSYLLSLFSRYSTVLQSITGLKCVITCYMLRAIPVQEAALEIVEALGTGDCAEGSWPGSAAVARSQLCC